MRTDIRGADRDGTEAGVAEVPARQRQQKYGEVTDGNFMSVQTTWEAEEGRAAVTFVGALPINAMTIPELASLGMGNAALGTTGGEENARALARGLMDAGRDLMTLLGEEA